MKRYVGNGCCKMFLWAIKVQQFAWSMPKMLEEIILEVWKRNLVVQIHGDDVSIITDAVPSVCETNPCSTFRDRGKEAALKLTRSPNAGGRILELFRESSVVSTQLRDNSGFETRNPRQRWQHLLPVAETILWAQSPMSQSFVCLLGLRSYRANCEWRLPHCLLRLRPTLHTWGRALLPNMLLILGANIN